MLFTTGEHNLNFLGQVGVIEALLTMPENPRLDWIAFLGHPHSLQGGTMSNKVITTLARLFRDLRIPSIRMNFRGVGKTEGVFDSGLGESEDVLQCIAQYHTWVPEARVMLAGFSFGSYVMYRVAQQQKTELLILVAPPVERFDYVPSAHMPPAIVVQGECDEVVTPAFVYQWVSTWTSPVELIRIAETSHFFHGKLLDLKQKLCEKIMPMLEHS